MSSQTPPSKTELACGSSRLMAQDLATSVEVVSSAIQAVPTNRLDGSEAERLIASIDASLEAFATDPKSSRRGHSCAALLAAKLRWRMLFGGAGRLPLRKGIPKLITSPDLLETESIEASTCTRSRVSNNLR